MPPHLSLFSPPIIPISSASLCPRGGPYPSHRLSILSTSQPVSGRLPKCVVCCLRCAVPSPSPARGKKSCANTPFLTPWSPTPFAPLLLISDSCPVFVLFLRARPDPIPPSATFRCIAGLVQETVRLLSVGCIEGFRNADIRRAFVNYFGIRGSDGCVVEASQ